VVETKWKGLKIQPQLNEDNVWAIKSYSDSDYCADKETRRSITGFIVYLMGVPISWKSKGQRGVVLSTTEAEYVAISETVREIKFIIQILESMALIIEYPVIVHVDNVGAIFLANNRTTGERTKHVDIRHHFVREYIEDGMVKIMFVRSRHNDADIFTKNLPGDSYERHVGKFTSEKI
jgi:ribosomal protein L24